MGKQSLFEALSNAKTDKQKISILQEWSQRCSILREVIEGSTSFESEANRVIENGGPKWRTEWYDAKTPRDIDIERCLGPFREVDFWYDLTLWGSSAAAIGVLFGLFSGSNIVRKSADQMTENEKKMASSVFATSPEPILSRRDFLYAFALKSAASFSLFGFAGGFVKNLWDKGSYRQRAKILDKAVSSYRHLIS